MIFKLICVPIFFVSVFNFGYIDIGDKIIEFAMKNLKKKVDRGECWDLANAALNSNNADWTSPFGFGTKINMEDAKRADIIQMTNIQMKFPNGSMNFPQHTAIILKKSGRQITLIHQNFNNIRYVDTLTINLDYIKKGKVEVFRPKAKL